MRVEYHPEARDELVDAVRWYAEEDPELAAAFRSAVRRAELKVAQAPTRWAPYVFGTRRLILKRFPYVLVYEFAGELVHVLAVAHVRRRPGYWARRASPG